MRSNRLLCAKKVICLGLAVAFFEYSQCFGILGEILITSFWPVFGWGIFVAGFVYHKLFMLFFSKVVFPFSRIVGIFLYLSHLSIIHLRYPWMSCTAPPPRVIRRIRWFCGQTLLRQVLGISSVGAAAIFITLLIIAVLLTFEVLLVAFLLFNPKLRLVRRRETNETPQKEEFEGEETRQRDFDSRNWLRWMILQVNQYRSDGFKFPSQPWLMK